MDGLEKAGGGFVAVRPKTENDDEDGEIIELDADSSDGGEEEVPAAPVDEAEVSATSAAVAEAEEDNGTNDGEGEDEGEDTAPPVFASDRGKQGVGSVPSQQRDCAGEKPPSAADGERDNGGDDGSEVIPGGLLTWLESDDDGFGDFGGGVDNGDDVDRSAGSRGGGVEEDDALRSEARSRNVLRSRSLDANGYNKNGDGNKNGGVDRTAAANDATVSTAANEEELDEVTVFPVEPADGAFGPPEAEADKRGKKLSEEGRAGTREERRASGKLTGENEGAQRERKGDDAAASAPARESPPRSRPAAEAAAAARGQHRSERKASADAVGARGERRASEGDEVGEEEEGGSARRGRGVEVAARAPAAAAHRRQPSESPTAAAADAAATSRDSKEPEKKKTKTHKLMYRVVEDAFKGRDGPMRDFLNRLLTERIEVLERGNASGGEGDERYQRFKKELKTRDDRESLPLYIACHNVALFPYRVIRALVGAYHFATAEEGLNGLPLHGACHPILSRWGDREEVPLPIEPRSDIERTIKLLAETYPRGVLTQNLFGSTALHSLLEHRPRFQLVRFVVDCGKDAQKELSNSDESAAKIADKSLLRKMLLPPVERLDHENQLPLHVAIERYASAKVVEYLVELYPASRKKKGRMGYLPLHSAGMWGCSRPVLKTLLQDEYAVCVATKNDNGDTPLHVLFSGVFEDENAERRFQEKFLEDGDIPGDKAPPPDLLSVRDMFEMMVQRYYVHFRSPPSHRYVPKKGKRKKGANNEAAAKKKLKWLLSSTRGAGKMTVVEAAQQCKFLAHESKFPDDFMEWIRALAKGETDDLERYFVEGEDDEDEEEVGRGGLPAAATTVAAREDEDQQDGGNRAVVSRKRRPTISREGGGGQSRDTSHRDSSSASSMPPPRAHRKGSDGDTNHTSRRPDDDRAHAVLSQARTESDARPASDHKGEAAATGGGREANPSRSRGTTGGGGVDRGRGGGEPRGYSIAASALPRARRKGKGGANNSSSWIDPRAVHSMSRMGYDMNPAAIDLTGDAARAREREVDLVESRRAPGGGGRAEPATSILFAPARTRRREDTESDSSSSKRSRGSVSKGGRGVFSESSGRDRSVAGAGAGCSLDRSTSLAPHLRTEEMQPDRDDAGGQTKPTMYLV